MEYKSCDSWNDLKLKNGIWWPYENKSKWWRAKKKDQDVIYWYDHLKSEYEDVGSDCKDFYDTIKQNVDNNIYSYDIRRSDCKQVIHVSNRKVGTVFNWTSYFDNTGYHDGSGIDISWNGTTDPAEQSVEGQFTQDVYITAGTLWWETMPKGSWFKFEAFCPDDGYYYRDSVTELPCAADNTNGTIYQNTTGDWLQVAEFQKIKIYNSNTGVGFTFNSSDLTTFLQGYKLKLTVTSGDATKTCSIWGMLEVGRKRCTS